MSSQGPEADFLPPSETGSMDGSGGGGIGGIVGRTTASEVLREVFGYPEFLPGQAEVVQHLVGGSDAFVLMPTGGGKSLCYQVPALVREGVGVVVSPLISLMKSQVDALRQAGVRAEAFNSTMDQSERTASLRRLQEGRVDLLYVSPERLMMEGFIDVLAGLSLALFAIDEAHCISQWGHDFRPEYVELGRIKERFPEVPVGAFTATADEQTRRDVLSRLGLPHAKVFSAGFDRPNIRYQVVEKDGPSRQLRRFVQERRGQAGIVYCLSRKRTEQVATALAEAGIAVAPYHAGLGGPERERVQDAFERDELQVVVATVAFGLGIDKPNVRYVVHYDVPKSLESYYQETGRAGRDGLPAEALLLYSPADLMLVKGLIGQGEEPDQVRLDLHKLNAMASYAEGLTCRRQALLGYFGEVRDHDCGNCDVCLDPPQWYEATEHAQKALSCVYRLGGRFGVNQVVDVLRGARTKRIRELRHDSLSTYGIGSDMSKEEWRDLVRQLIHRGYLRQDVGDYSVLKLTERAKPVLAGTETLTLARPRGGVLQSKAKGGTPSDGSGKRGADTSPEISVDDEPLFESLRGLRRRLADEQGVPAYVIFNDATLLEMVGRRPATAQELLAVKGIGRKKMEAYGRAFLEVIVSDPAHRNVS